jgi:hypothetical protein
MNTIIDHDDAETILQSSHREWVENPEREQQSRDKLIVERFWQRNLIRRKNHEERIIDLARSVFPRLAVKEAQACRDCVLTQANR